MPMYMFKMIYFIFPILLLSPVASFSPTVVTENGKIEGIQHKSRNTVCDVFLGIPFAEPPTGERRFKKPVPLQSGPENLMKADKQANRCIQTVEGRNELFEFEPESEDCLYLNIIAPAEKKAGNLPVMVFIHGGAFHSGSARQYGVDGPCANIVSKDVILVIIQYRLGVLGFMSTGDASASGNWGIWDQIQALKWVKANIGSFGGDADSVTIFGESAGAFSVSLLSYSDITQDLYHRSIQQSGSTLTPLFLKENHVEGSKLLAEYACSLKDQTSKQIVECLRSLSADDLHSKTLKVFDKFLRDPNAPVAPDGWAWVPVVDGDIVKHNAMALHQMANSKPAILGTNAFEMGWFVQPPTHLSETVKHFLTALNEDQITVAHFQFLISAMLPSAVDGERAKSIIKVAQHVYDLKAAEGNTTKLLEQYITLVNDLWFNVPTVLDVTARKAAGASVFVNPNPTEPSWPEWISVEEPYNYRIGLNSEVEDDFHSTGVIFWTQVVPELLKTQTHGEL